MKKIFLFLLIVICFHQTACGQKQLVLLRKQKVMLRLYPGDEIILKLRGSKKLKKSYVNNLFANEVVTHRDTIPFHKIEKIYFRHHSRLNVIGTTLVLGGITLLVIDQINHSVVQGNDWSVDSGFTTTTLGVVAVGLPMMLLKKKSEKINYRNRLMVVSKGSIFYKPDTRGFISPYIDN